MRTSEKTVRAAGSLEQELASAVGEARARPYGEDGRALLVRAAGIDDIRSSCEIAHSHRVPLLARAPGLDTSEIEPPAEGGVILDLEPMNRILEVNHSRRYAVVEPGVNWRNLESLLLEEGGDLALPTVAAPTCIGPWASCLYDGAEGCGLALGHLGRNILGVEAVLPCGEIVRTGSWACKDTSWGRGPHPDLGALFRRWRGGTGIVTRLSISLPHRRRYVRRLLLPTSERRAAIAASIRLARTNLFDDSHVIPWTLPRALMKDASLLEKPDKEPDAWLAVDFSADSLPELEYKRVRLAQAISRSSRRGGRFDDPMPLDDLVRVACSLQPLEDLPVALSSRNLDAEPLRMIGLHGPVSILVDGADAATSTYEAHGLPCITLVRPKPGGYQGLLHVSHAGRAGRAPPESLEKAELEALSKLMDLGFIPHRFPSRSSKMVGADMDEATKRLGEKVRATLDPHRLLDPLRWGLPAPF